MATLEQLNLMMEQMKRMNCQEPLIKEKANVKLEPQPTTSTKSDFLCDKCVNYDSLFHQILSKLDKQTQIIERIETKLEEVNAAVFRLDVWGQPCFIAPEPENLDSTSTKEEVTYTHYESLIKEEPKEEEEDDDEVVIVEPIKIKVEVIEVEVPNVTLDIKEIEDPIEEEEVADEDEEEEVVEEEQEEVVADEEEEVVLEEEVVADQDLEDEVVVSEEQEEVVSEEEEVVADEVVSEEEEVVADEVVSDDSSEEEEVITDESSEEEEVKEVVVKEEEEEEVQEEEVDDDEEVFEIEIDDVTYFATDEENGILYEMDKNGEVGKKVGIIKDGEPIFS